MNKLFIALLCTGVQAFAAERYFVDGGTDVNYGTITNWAVTDGGPGGFSVPGSSDNVHFTALSPDVIINTIARSAGTLDFTGYAHTINMSAALAVSGNVTLSPTMSVTGTGTLSIGAASTLTANGKTWTAPLVLVNAGTVTITLADDWTVTGGLTIATGTSPQTVTLNGSHLSIASSLTLGNTVNGVTVAGTTQLVLTGTGTLGSSATTGASYIKCPLKINTSGTITISPTNAIGVNLAAFEHVSGTVIGPGTWYTGGSGTVSAGQRVYSSIQ